MTARILSLVALIAVACAFVGCSRAIVEPPNDPPEEVPPITPINVPPEDLKALVDGNNQFAIDLYKKLAEKEGNIVFSPYSISSALAMAYAGARGETAEQMAKVLGITKLGDRVHPAHADLGQRLKSGGGKDKPEFHVANSLWGQRGMPFLPEFLNLTKRHYDGGFREVDFVDDTEGARRTINGWVGEQTKEKIPELLKPNVLSSDTQLVLTNAIYFKGDWALPFNSYATKDGPFHCSPTNSVTVPLMSQEATLRYAEAGDARVLELPYVGGEYSMVLVLPKRQEDMGRVQAGLSGGSLDAWLAKASEREVKVTLPRFRMRVPADLIPPLKQLGMVAAFDNADFSGLTGARGLRITAVVHEAFIDVDEKGTEAAAATAASLAGAPRLLVEFRVDRPSIVAIRHRDSGCVLFLGKVTDPAQRQ